MASYRTLEKERGSDENTKQLCAPQTCACPDDVRQFSSSEPSSQSRSPSQSGFSLLMHFPFLQRKVNSEQRCSTTAEEQDGLVLVPGTHVTTAEITFHQPFSDSDTGSAVFSV